MNRIFERFGIFDRELNEEEMYQLAIIPLPDGGVDYTVLDSEGEDVLFQGTILPADISLPTIQGIFSALSPEDHARILETIRSLTPDSDAAELQIPEY